MDKYIEDEAEFDPIKKHIAECKGYAKWEDVCENSATGDDEGKSNTASLQMVMRNKFGWDKEQKTQHSLDEEQKKQEYEKNLKKVTTQLSELQNHSTLKIADNKVNSEYQS